MLRFAVQACEEGWIHAYRDDVLVAYIHKGVLNTFSNEFLTADELRQIAAELDRLNAEWVTNQKVDQ